MAPSDDMLDDEDYPAYTMGRAAEIVGCSQDFLRRLGDAELIDPHRSAGGHRRYSRHQLELAARVRGLLDDGHLLSSAQVIVQLQDDLADARSDVDTARAERDTARGERDAAARGAGPAAS